MNRFEELLRSVSAQPGDIVHLGAGMFSEYELYKSLNADRIIFVEPDQHLVAQVNNKFSKLAEVSIVSKAIAPVRGRRFLNIVNNRRYSSLLSPAKLLQFYPNVLVTGKDEVETITLEDLCNELNIEDEADNLLVAELQGLEYTVFPSLTKNVLQKFKWILVRSSAQDIYQADSGKTQQSFSTVIENAGYQRLVFEENTPPFTNILYLRNESFLENIELGTRAADLTDQVNSLERSMTKLKKRYKTKQEEIKKSLKINSEKITELQANLASRTAETELLKEQNTQLDEQNTQLNEQNSKLSLDVKGFSNAIDTSETKIAEMEQALRINNKLLYKSDADLRDLQLQYSNSLQHQEQQNSLLLELREKLSQASEFYQKLNLQDSILDGDTLPQANPKSSEPHKNDRAED